MAPTAAVPALPRNARLLIGPPNFDPTSPRTSAFSRPDAPILGASSSGLSPSPTRSLMRFASPSSRAWCEGNPRPLTGNDGRKSLTSSLGGAVQPVCLAPVLALTSDTSSLPGIYGAIGAVQLGFPLPERYLS
jgi:hypothetical protein